MGFVTTLAIVTGGLTAVAVVPTLLSANDPREAPPLLGALESTVAPLVAGSIPEVGEFPAPDEAAAGLAVAREAPAPVKDLAVLQGDAVSRDGFTETFDAGGGLMATTVSPVQRNMLVGGGDEAQWVPIAKRLIEAEGGGFTASPHPLAPIFAATTTGAVFSLTIDGYPISWRLLDAAESRAELGEDGASVVYRQVWPGIDLRYTLDGPSVKEEFVIAEVPSDERPTPEFRFVVDSPGLALVPAEDGSLRFLDSEGVERALVPPPLMWDSSEIPDERAAEITRVALKVEPWGSAGGASEPPESTTEDGTTGEAETEVDTATGAVAEGTPTSAGPAIVTIAPDPEWLRAPERVFPVTVDPTSTPFGYSAANSWKLDGTPYYGSLHIGSPTPSTIWRGFMQWNLGSIAGNLVYDTTMVIAYDGSGTTNCYSGWVGTVATWPPSSFHHYNNDVADYVLCDSDAYASYMITDALDTAVAGYIRGGSTSPWLAIRGDESGAYSYKRVDAALVVWWYAKPAVTGVTGATPTGGAVGPRVPTMQGTGTDPLGHGLQYRYEFEEAGPSEDGAGPFTNIVYSTPWVEAGPYTISSLALQPGTHYRYRVTARDAADGHLGNDTKHTLTNTAWHFVTNEPPVVSSVGAVPAVTDSLAPTVVTESGPVFSVPYAGRPGYPATTVEYRFTVATGGDGKVVWL